MNIHPQIFWMLIYKKHFEDENFIECVFPSKASWYKLVSSFLLCISSPPLSNLVADRKYKVCPRPRGISEQCKHWSGRCYFIELWETFEVAGLNVSWWLITCHWGRGFEGLGSCWSGGGNRGRLCQTGARMQEGQNKLSLLQRLRWTLTFGWMGKGARPIWWDVLHVQTTSSLTLRVKKCCGVKYGMLCL